MAEKSLFGAELPPSDGGRRPAGQVEGLGEMGALGLLVLIALSRLDETADDYETMKIVVTIGIPMAGNWLAGRFRYFMGAPIGLQIKKKLGLVIGYLLVVSMIGCGTVPYTAAMCQTDLQILGRVAQRIVTRTSDFHPDDIETARILLQALTDRGCDVGAMYWVKEFQKLEEKAAL